MPRVEERELDVVSGRPGIAMLQTPFIGERNFVFGIHRQGVELNGTSMYVSYLRGTGPGKICGDYGIAGLFAPENGLVGGVLEVDDYLSRAKTDVWWDLAAGVLGDTMNPDAQGARLSAEVNMENKGVGVVLSNLIDQKNVQRLGSRTDILNSYQMVIADSLVKTWLSKRNRARFEVIGKIIDRVKSEGIEWNPYWLNACISCMGLAMHRTGEALSYGHAVMSSNADIYQGLWQTGTDRDIRTAKDAQNWKNRMNIGDINAVFDRWFAKGPGGLSPEAYADKTGPEGIYMTWGDPNGWLERAVPRTYHDWGANLCYGDKNCVVMAAASDGIIYNSRKVDRTRSLETDERFQSYVFALLNYGPNMLYELLLAEKGFPSDDFLIMAVEYFVDSSVDKRKEKPMRDDRYVGDNRYAL